MSALDAALAAHDDAPVDRQAQAEQQVRTALEAALPAEVLAELAPVYREGRAEILVGPHVLRVRPGLGGINAHVFHAEGYLTLGSDSDTPALLRRNLLGTLQALRAEATS